MDGISPGARVLALVNPNNPTGSFVKRANSNISVSLGIPMVSDEVFSDYAFAPDPDRIATLVDVEGVS